MPDMVIRIMLNQWMFGNLGVVLYETLFWSSGSVCLMCSALLLLTGAPYVVWREYSCCFTCIWLSWLQSQTPFLVTCAILRVPLLDFQEPCWKRLYILTLVSQLCFLVWNVRLYTDRINKPCLTGSLITTHRQYCSILPGIWLRLYCYLALGQRADTGNGLWAVTCYSAGQKLCCLLISQVTVWSYYQWLYNVYMGVCCIFDEQRLSMLAFAECETCPLKSSMKMH